MQRYVHSGTVSASGAILALLMGLPTAVVGGFVYAFLAWWMNWGPFRFVLMLVFALIVGGFIAIGANRGKIRSPLFNTVLALVCAAVGLWIYWGAYDVARHGIAVAPTAWTPAGLTRHGQELFQDGSFTMKGKRTVKGWMLVGFWIAEGLAVTGIVVALARLDAQRPFCETCLEWTNSTSGLMRLQADGKEPAWTEVLGGDLPALAVFSPTGAGTSPHVRLDLASCPKCEHSNYVTLTAVTITRNSKGQDKTTQRAIIVNGAITDPEAAFLREFAKQLHGHAEGDAAEDEEEGEEDQAGGGAIDETNAQGSPPDQQRST
jgi:hypothetical protein